MAYRCRLKQTYAYWILHAAYLIWERRILTIPVFMLKNRGKQPEKKEQDWEWEGKVKIRGCPIIGGTYILSSKLLHF